MNEYKRVAFFFAPVSQSPLATFGAHWLGWDAQAGKSVPHLDVLMVDKSGLNIAISDIVATPSKYGFHGTLKAPFRLANGKSINELCDAGHKFGKQIPKFTLETMHLAQLGSFIAITQAVPSAELNQLASKIVRNFDSFRAPLTEQDIAKRRQQKLTARQDELMLKWGYPFIFEAFKFHLTLSGKLEPDQMASTLNVLKEHLTEILKDPIEVNDICLFGERSDGRFEIIERFPLLG
tara:strand:- start:1536 stop:2243 length:708 start_codon:yes stop_codon:yes gene_type:complete